MEIIFVVLALIAIFPPQNLFKQGAIVSSIDTSSPLYQQGLAQGQIITSVDNTPVKNIADYTKIIQNKFPSSTNVKTIIDTSDGKEYTDYSKTAPNLTVSDIKKTNIKAGLDLVGGSEALVQAKDMKLTSAQADDLVQITQNRLNAFGLTDIKVSSVSDLQGNHYMSIQVAGATQGDLEQLISQQGKFEAKIGNDTVFTGGKQDITDVGRSSQNAYISSCNQAQGGSYVCQFTFTVFLSQSAAEREASITKDLSVNVSSSGQNYLSKTLDLYVDDKLQDSLQISADLKGQVATQVSIQGSGTGATNDEALQNAEDNMKHLQTILITGSLPFQLQIVKLDTISPLLGTNFIKIILIAAALAELVVVIIIFVRFKKFKQSLALILLNVAEIIIILGVAALIKWNLDLPSIAGILATIGTGVDSEIVILDESRHTEENLSMKEKMKRAFAIILGAYFTAVAALIPLYWAAAGLLKGFAVTTLIGISIGVLVTRPAFIDIIKMIDQKHASS